jgi:hypothetical protein
MKEEDKKLLLKDLSARLTYDVKVYVKNWSNLDSKYYEGVYTVKSTHPSLNTVLACSDKCSVEVIVGYYDYHIKPYLFPMSSMTREQKIMILGDADCLSTSELSRRYRGISSSNFSLINVIFFWMSDGEAPVDIRRPGYIDNDILVSTTAFTVAKVIFMGVIPVALLLFAIILWIRRKGR